MKKGMIVLVLFALMIVPVTAIDSSGSVPFFDSVKQGECIDISQVCASCSFVNISSVSHKDNSTLLSNVGMNYFGNAEWRYEFCNTTLLGRYDVRGQGDINTVDSGFAIWFEVTPSGRSGTENIIFFLVVLFLLYGISLLGFFNENALPTMLAGMALVFLGIYMVNNGIIIYRDNLTNYIAYITSFWGGASTLFAIWKEYLENF